MRVSVWFEFFDGLFFNVKPAYGIWEEIVTTKIEIWIEDIRSWGFQDIEEEMTLRKWYYGG